MDTKELLVSVLTSLAQVMGAEVAAAPSSWSRALFWLYNKMEELDWTVRFHLKPVWGEHFKNEVPSSMLTVCNLPEQVGTPLETSFRDDVVMSEFKNHLALFHSQQFKSSIQSEPFPIPYQILFNIMMIDNTISNLLSNCSSNHFILSNKTETQSIQLLVSDLDLSQ